MVRVKLPEVPGFRLERQLGEGAYGRVYLARELEGLARPVALKLFSVEGHEAFTRELEVLRRVEELRRQGRHPEIVQTLGSGEHEGRGWIALEYLEDGSLKDVVDRRGPLPWAEALESIRQATAAVAVLHDAGLFHRDVKPANLLVGADGRVRLGDFGLSRDLDGTLSAAGSPAFAAPEVIAGQVGEGQRARVDVYGLGATLAFLLTGEPARPGRPDAFALERSGAPRPLCDLLLEAMAYEPEERYADAPELGIALQRVTDTLRTLPGGSEGASEEDDRMKEAVAERPPAPAPRTDLDLEVQHPRCPFCHEPIVAEDSKQACVACMAWHHAACWGESGRCAACQAVSEAVALQPKVATQPKPKRTAKLLIAVVVATLTALLLVGLSAYVRSMATARAQAEEARTIVPEAERHPAQIRAPQASAGAQEPQVEGFSFLREETFSSGGQRHTVKVFRCEAFAKALGLTDGQTDPACEFVLVPGGTFSMGSPADEVERSDDEGPQHQVRIKPLFVARTEVTQAVWQGVMGSSPSRFKGGRLPVEQVSWDDAISFCKKTGLRLPSEAEWEYACRAGTTTPFAFGETITRSQVNHDRNDPNGGAAGGTYRKRTTDVGSFPANAFGLFDVHGNVWEWCQDSTSQSSYLGAPTDGSAWEKPWAYLRLYRGGSWYRYAQGCRSAYRSWGMPDYQRFDLGFRPASSR